MAKRKRSKRIKGEPGSLDVLTPVQLDLLRCIVDLAEDNTQAYVCLYTAAMKAQMSLKEAQHIVYALLESDMLDEFNGKMQVSITNQAVLYCFHHQETWFKRFWRTHTEAIIRGMFGTVGAILGALATLIVKALFFAGRAL